MGASSEPIRVLHVDDDPAFVDMAATFLEREDDRIDVVTATSADEGLSVLEETGIDCVVSDYDMPGLDGIDFLERVRGVDDDRPFILFTGKGSEEVASEAISAGVTDYLQKSTGSEQYEILVNRIVNAVEAARTRERATRQEHSNTLIRELNRRLVAADTVDEIETAVCRTLANADPIRFAWIGEPDTDTGEIVPRTSAGDAEGYLDEVTIYCDERPRGLGPGGRAVRTGELQVARIVRDDPSFEPWQDAAARYGYESVTAIPLSYGGGQSGLLALYAGEPDAFDDIELTVLEELGETISHALEAAGVRRHLELRWAAETDRQKHYYRTLADALPNGAVALFDTDLILPAVSQSRNSSPWGDEFLETVTADSIRYTVVGGAVFDELSLSPREMEGELLTDVHSEAYRNEYLDHYRAALDGEERTFEFAYEGRTFEAHVAPIRDEAGAVVGGLAMTQDVTERVSRQQELERRERVLRGMYEAVSDPSLSVEDGVRALLRIGTDALGAQYGVLSRIEDGGHVLEFVHATEGAVIDGDDPVADDAAPKFAEYCERVIRAGETVTVGDTSEAAEFATGNSERGPSSYIGAPVVVDGDAYGTFCFYGEEPRSAGFAEWEVTLVDLLCRWVGAALDRRETNARLRARNERFREFTKIVSHDLRNPITVLGGALELAERTGDSEQFDRCRRALARMDALVEDLSTLTRDGAVVEETGPLELGRTARACWETVDTGDAELLIEDDATILADEDRLRQVFENLFRNCIEHGVTDGEPAPDAADPLTVRVGVLPTDDGVYVEDDGPGIPEERRREVFEQGYSTTTGGTGLGLAIVEKMATAHGWTVAVTQGREGGARIEISGVEVD